MSLNITLGFYLCLRICVASILLLALPAQAQNAADGFAPQLDNTVFAIAAQADGKLLIGGAFTTVDGIVRRRLARLNVDGSLDSTFDLVPEGQLIGMTQQTDGRILVFGNFRYHGPDPRHLARLSLPNAALQSLTLEGPTVHWRRSGASPELALPPVLSLSTDGQTFSDAGTFARAADGWTAPAPAIGVGQTLWLRAEGRVTSGTGNRSTSLIESTLVVHRDDQIFRYGLE